MANLSRLRRERMFDFLNNLKVENRHNEKILQSIAEIENELNEKKYGLVWEEHSEQVDEMMVDNIPILLEDKSREISTVSDDGYNFLIEGDNLHSLNLLEKTHHEKIDVIYIDPPYNTGNGDFMYDDNYVGLDDGYRHSKWLSFMARRLEIAKNLLTDDGLIFISIDDNELYQLKILCDSIFGENNYVNTIAVKVSESSGVKMAHIEKRLPKTKEYLLFYKKNKVKLSPILLPKEKWDEEYKTIITGITSEDLAYIKSVLSNPDRSSDDLLRANQLLSSASYCSLSEYCAKNNIAKNEREDFRNENSFRIFRTAAMSENALATVNRHRDANPNNIFFAYITPQNKGYLIKGDYDDSSRRPRVQVLFADEHLMYNPCDLWVDVKTTGLDAEGSINFKNGKKPVKLIKRILQLASDKKDITVLDFFAGSGTTAQAVLELNKEDDGERRFILCTNNESNICSDVTYPRIKTVITGVRPDGFKYSDGIPANLKYYKTEFIAKDSEMLVDDLITHTDEMIQLEYGVQIDKDRFISVLTDEEANELFENWDKYPNIKAIYVSRHVILSAEQRKLFYTKDVYIIPDYYYREELREVGE